MRKFNSETNLTVVSNQRNIRCAIPLLILGLSAVAEAAPITLSGNFVQVTISDDGTLGNGVFRPGLIYDATGTGTFDTTTDYIAPGDPFEGFGFRSAETGLIFNDNSILGGDIDSMEGFLLAGISDTSIGSTNSVTWSGTDRSNSVAVNHLYSFGDNDERIDIFTTFTALISLSDVTFSRAVDPDAGGTNSMNQRGLDSNGDGDFLDAGDLSMSDFVTSVGDLSGLPLGLFSNSPIGHDTGILTNCCSTLDPLAYFGGGDFPNGSTGDDGLGIAFMLGSLAAGESQTISYSYVMGSSLAAIDVPSGPDPVPLPASIMMMLVGLLGLKLRKKASHSV